MEGGDRPNDVGAAGRMFHDHGRSKHEKPGRVADRGSGGIGHDDEIRTIIGYLSVSNRESLICRPGDGTIAKAPFVSDRGRTFSTGMEGGALANYHHIVLRMRLAVAHVGGSGISRSIEAAHAIGISGG